MEFDNGTYPHLNDTDDDSQSRIREGTEEFTLNYYQDFSLSDGREILKYGTNPLDNDTDWDMLPDWYEYALAWNESLIIFLVKDIFLWNGLMLAPKKVFRKNH